MSEKQEKTWGALCELDGETVARLFLDYHGMQLLDEGFYEYLQEEGVLEPDVDEPEYDEIINAAKDADAFDDFCSSFSGCVGCPFHYIIGDCENELWPEWKNKNSRYEEG